MRQLKEPSVAGGQRLAMMAQSAGSLSLKAARVLTRKKTTSVGGQLSK